jgi:hypothetical protein
MAFETVKKLHKHFSFLAEGKFTEADFVKEFGNKEDDGRTMVGKMPKDRINLIISDAKKNKAALELKFPALVKKDKPVISKEQTKSKDKI